MDTLQLVDNIRRGQDVRAAQEELYVRVREKIMPRLAQKIPSRLKSRLDPEDIVHEAFLKALGALDLFRPTSEVAFFAWVYNISKNLLIDTARRRSAGAVHFVAGQDGGKGPRASAVKARQRRPESQLQEKDWVESILRRMKDKEAEVIRLHKLRGLSFEEIAKEWDKTPGAVQRFYSRAFARFRELVTTCSWDDLRIPPQ